MYFIASDHAGVKIKNFIMDYFSDKNIKFKDVAPLQEDAKVDYPDIASMLCEELISSFSSNKSNKGILICGSGIGVSIKANRFSQIRAALCVDEYMAKMAIMHNDANVLCLGERVIALDKVQGILESFLNATFEGGRHLSRVQKL